MSNFIINPFRKSPFSGSWLSNEAAIETDASTYTFSGVSFGAEDASRYIHVAYTGLKAASVSISSATIGGVSATVVDVVPAGSWSYVAHLYALVPTGSSGDIVINFGGTQDAGICSVYRIVSPSNLPSAGVDSYYYSATGTSISGSPTLTEGSFIIASGKADNSNAITWTNITEDKDVAFASGNRRATAASALVGSSGSLTITAAGSGSTLRKFHLIEWKK